MYEMLVGFPPFYSDDPMTTCRKVTNPLLLPSQVLHFFSDSNVGNVHVLYSFVYADCKLEKLLEIPRRG